VYREYIGFEGKGVELEDDGGGGTEQNHWEKRIMGNDIMVGNLAEDITVSPITLKVFEAIGWEIDWVASANSPYTHESYI